MASTYFTAMRRNRYDIFLEILDVCRKEQRVSSIMQKCKLSYAQTAEFLTHLNDCGLLKREGTSYKSTDEGLIFLAEFEKSINKLNSVSPSQDESFVRAKLSNQTFVPNCEGTKRPSRRRKGDMHEQNFN